MIGNQEYKILINAIDFKNALAPYGFTWSETPTTDMNRAYHDSTRGHVVVNSDSGTRGFFYIVFENASVGDLIEIEMSVKAVNFANGLNNSPSIGIHQVDAGTVEGNQKFVQQKYPTTSEWETVRFTHFCTETRAVRCDFGMYAAEKGTFYIKYGRATINKLKI